LTVFIISLKQTPVESHRWLVQGSIKSPRIKYFAAALENVLLSNMSPYVKYSENQVCSAGSN